MPFGEVTAMRRLTVVLCLGCTFVLLATALAETDRERDGLIGPVGAVCEIHTHGSEIGMRTATYYDVRGNKTHATVHTSDGQVYARSIYTYDSAGRLTGEDVWLPLSDSVDGWRTVYTYDAQGRLAEKAEHWRSGDLRIKTTYLYDSNGHKIEEVRDDLTYPQDVQRTRRTYRYDDAGNMIEQARYGANGPPTERETYVYDAHGRRSSTSIYEADGSLLVRYKHVYDARGNKIEQANSGEDGIVFIRWISTYDAHGNMTRHVAQFPDGSSSWEEVGTYEYDSRGNWTKRTWSESLPGEAGSQSESAQITTRAITYYADYEAAGEE